MLARVEKSCSSVLSCRFTSLAFLDGKYSNLLRTKWLVNHVGTCYLGEVVELNHEYFCSTDGN